MPEKHINPAEDTWRSHHGTTQLARPIVVGVDDTPGSQLALRWAVQAARRHRLPLQIVRVAEHSGTSLTTYNPPGSGGAFVVREPAPARQSIDDFNEAMAYARDRLPSETVSGLHTPGRATNVLLHEAREAQMIVMGSRGRSAVKAALLGSASASVAAHAKRPVVVVRPTEDDADKTRPVVVGVDGSSDSYQAMRFAFAEASVRRRPLRIVHCRSGLAAEAVEWNPSFTDILPDLPAELAADHAQFPGVDATVLLVSDDPSVILAEQSHKAELLVVGSRGRGRLAGLLLGSVSQSVLHHAHCTVAVTHQERS